MRFQLVLVLVLAAAGTVAAQEELASVNVTAVDRLGQFVGDLNVEEVRVFANGKEAEVKEVTFHVDQPRDVMLIMDQSGSSREALAAIKRVALEVVRRVMPREQDTLHLIGFNDEVHFDGAISTAQDAEKKIGRLEGFGGSAVHDAVIEATRRLQGMGDAGSSKRRRVIVLLSDGQDNASRHSVDRRGERRREPERQSSPFTFPRS